MSELSSSWSEEKEITFEVSASKFAVANRSFAPDQSIKIDSLSYKCYRADEAVFRLYVYLGPLCQAIRRRLTLDILNPQRPIRYSKKKGHESKSHFVKWESTSIVDYEEALEHLQSSIVASFIKVKRKSYFGAGSESRFKATSEILLPFDPIKPTRIMGAYCYIELENIFNWNPESFLNSGLLQEKLAGILMRLQKSKLNRARQFCPVPRRLCFPDMDEIGEYMSRVQSGLIRFVGISWKPGYDSIATSSEIRCALGNVVR